jgi:hypothetical protein
MRHWEGSVGQSGRGRGEAEEPDRPVLNICISSQLWIIDIISEADNRYRGQRIFRGEMSQRVCERIDIEGGVLAPPLDHHECDHHRRGTLLLFIGQGVLGQMRDVREIRTIERQGLLKAIQLPQDNIEIHFTALLLRIQLQALVVHES